MIKTILSSLFLFFIVFANAQETEQGEEEKEKRHSIAVLISHTQVAETVEGEGKKSMYPPGESIITSGSLNSGPLVCTTISS